MLVHGKTAVLVERIINKVINEKIDIDRLLIVTFTKAAASEMRERIANRLYDELDSHPELQEQIKLFSKSYITTIDSFCVRIVRDNFFKLGLDPNFKIEDQAECDILKLEALDELLEEEYSSDDEDFNEIFKMYSSNKDDDNLRALILGIYNFIMSCPYPTDWLNEKVNEFDLDDSITDLSQTKSGKLVINYSKSIIENAINQLKDFNEELIDTGLGSKYVDCIEEDIQNLEIIHNTANTWDDLFEQLSCFKFKAANGAKGVPEELKKRIKEERDAAGGIIKEELIGKYFVGYSRDLIPEYKTVFNSIKCICNIVIEFSNLYNKKKQEKNILDFSDEEHYALKLLAENPDIADNYRQHFKEILIDEYQDSNMLQEYILNSISNNNIFMVGDVKQSIYKFRHARPELFLEKYNTYSTVTNNDESISKKVLLFKNFRSNKNIIDQINFVFENIMSKSLGDIEYNEEEFLKFGADCYIDDGEKAELVLIEKKPSNIELDEDAMYDANPNLEGRFIAKKIKELIGNVTIYDKNNKVHRKAMYKDIVILLRSTVNRVDYFTSELANLNIPVYTESGGDYFNNIEVQTIMSLLRIIDNPYQDISLVGVLRSQIGGFNVDELSSIRIVDRKVYFYEAMLKCLSLENELSKKVSVFLDKLHSWREKSKYLSLWELLWQIYNETGYYYYVSLFPDGIKRVNNLKLLLERAERFEKTSIKGLFSFLNYIDNIKASSQDFGDSKQIGENEDVVRIMSVHKSKGLEFPIVFLAGTDTPFYTRDLKEDIIFDLDEGFGLNIIDYDTNIKYPHISKNALEIKRRADLKSEEMRILYVALTRARERLIVTGLVKNAESAYKNYSKKIAKYKIDNSNCFLDWLGYTIVNKSNDWIVTKVPYGVEDSIIEDEDESNNIRNLSSISCSEEVLSKFYPIIDEQMNWIYKYDSSTHLPNKVSISELKRLHQMSSEDTIEVNNEVIPLIKMPDFLNGEIESGAKFGTIMHETLQHLNFSNYSFNIVSELVDSLTDDEQIKKFVISKIDKFSKTDLFKNIAQATKVYKETAFNLNLKANEIYKIDSNDNVMIQGIIDLYYINSNGEIVLVDYKTDSVNNELELINRYKIQIDLYKRAIEEITGMKVNKSIIYSFKLEKEIYV